MTPPPPHTPLIVRVTRFLPAVERVFLITFTLGLVLFLLSVDIRLVKISLIALGITYFLYAYRPMETGHTEDEKFEFAELFACMILPKVMWMSSAISVLAIALYQLDFENPAYKRILSVGALALGISMVLLVVFLLRGVKHMSPVVAILWRAVPLFVIDMYGLMK